MTTGWPSPSPARPKRFFHGRPDRRALALVGVVATIAGLVLAVILVFAWPRPSTVLFEVVRVCLQVLGVSVVGFFVGAATFDLQQARLERQRRDDRIRAFLTEMLGAYHGVKQVRRVLKAETAPEREPAITAEAYSRLLSELSEHQLVFESLARSAPLIQCHVIGGYDISVDKAGDRRGSDGQRETVTKPISAHCTEIENYLNRIVEEFESNSHCMPKVGRTSFSKTDFTATRGFIYDKDEFRAKASRRIDAIVTALETTLLTPGRIEAASKPGRADLSHRDLSGIHMRRTRLRSAVAMKTILRKARLEHADLRGAVLWGADMQDANLAGSDLRNASLVGANLRGANLEGVRLKGARLGRFPTDTLTRLENGTDSRSGKRRRVHNGADLSNAKGLRVEQVLDACLDETTTLPPHIADDRRIRKRLDPNAQQ